MSEDPTIAIVEPVSSTTTTATGAIATPKPLSLRRNISWTFAGNLVYFGCQWGILMVLAKLGTPETVGVFGLALVVSAPIFMFANLQLASVQATDATRQYRFAEYFALRLVTTILALAVITPIALAGGFQPEAAFVIVAVGAAKAFEALSDIIYGLLRQQERMDRIARLQVTKGLMSLGAVGAAMYFTGSVVWAVAALAVVWGMRLVAFDFPSAAWVLGAGWRQLLRPGCSLVTLARLAWPALPLGFATLLVALSTSIPCYFIDYHLGTRELGFFVAIASFMKLGYMVFGALAQSTSPRLAKHYADQNIVGVRRLLLKVLGIASIVGVSGVLAVGLAGREILMVLFTAEYAQYVSVFFWLVLATTISFQGSLDQALIALKGFKHLLGVWVITVLSLILLSSMLVPKLGLLGAGIAVFAANVVRLIAMVAAFWHKRILGARALAHD